MAGNVITPLVNPLQGSTVSVVTSADFPQGLSAFADWRAFSDAASGRAGAAVTASLCFGCEPVGFLSALLPAPPRLGGGAAADRPELEQLAALARSLAAAVALRRLRGAHASSLAAARAGAPLLPAAPPPGGDGGAAFPERVARRLEAAHAHAPQPPHAGAALAPGPGSGSLRCPIPLQSELDDLDWGTPRHPGHGAAAAAHLPASASASGHSGEPADLLVSEYWPCVTIIFADVINFTEMTSNQDPSQTMEILGSLFHMFDSLTLSHGVYKVETVADTFMAASGVSPERPDHAQAALMLALDFHSAASTVLGATGAPLRLRVGLHTGPVRGGVIGNVRARFALFGDVVNTASRMESTAEPGTVQLSQETFDVLGLDAAHFEQRERKVKGKGEMVTYSLCAGAEAAAEVRRLLGALVSPTDDLFPPQPPGERGPGGSIRGQSSTGPGSAFGSWTQPDLRVKRASSGVLSRWEQAAGGAHHHPLRESSTTGGGSAAAGPSLTAASPSFALRRRTTDTSHAGLFDIRERSFTAASTQSAGDKNSETHQSGIVSESMTLLEEKTLEMMAVAVFTGMIPTLLILCFPFGLVFCGCGRNRAAQQRLLSRPCVPCAMRLRAGRCLPRAPGPDAACETPSTRDDNPRASAFPPGWVSTVLGLARATAAVSLLLVLNGLLRRHIPVRGRSRRIRCRPAQTAATPASLRRPMICFVSFPAGAVPPPAQPHGGLHRRRELPLPLRRGGLPLLGGRARARKLAPTPPGRRPRVARGPGPGLLLAPPHPPHRPPLPVRDPHEPRVRP